MNNWSFPDDTYRLQLVKWKRKEAPKGLRSDHATGDVP
jgi:hypothetical protein